MLDSTTVNRFNYNINAVSGTLRKSHPKSKIMLRTLDRYLTIFDEDKPTLDTTSHDEIIILQIMLLGNDRALIEYVLKKDFSEVEDLDSKLKGEEE
ncbi:hypothetical protein [uncultured Eubacterium sp.]|uniref:hypothetical protein n=1 Tax=uncultured Eubacterium sp. TaxID=165185 RepID=UPI00262093A7|nr:hypothetical protein [uncultured Eubacterium sp.]